MDNFQVSPHFRIAELVSKSVLVRWGKNSLWFIDPRIITYLEFMRVRFGVTHINNWIDGGKLDSRGFRSPSDTDGGSMSQHRFGRAVDATFKNATPDEVRQDIINCWPVHYKQLGITTIEADVSWVHSDMRFIPNQKELFIVKP